MQNKPMPEQGAPAEGGAPAPAEGQPQAGGKAANLSPEQSQEIAKGISDKAVQLMSGMEELGFVLSELGVPPEQLEKLAGEFNAFLQTIKGILGGGDSAESAPEGEANQPVDANGGAGAVPYDQGMASAGKNKARPMVG